nr:hypothetical protein [Tanacetum cinerariifolium]
NINLAQQVAMGSQLQLRFEQEAKLLKKSVAQVARRDKRIQAMENEIKNLETLLEAETHMKETAKAKNAELDKELENLWALQISNDHKSQIGDWVRVALDGYEVRDPTYCKEEILLADAIAANVGRAEKKKKCRVVCHTHGVGSAHHARSDGVLVSVPTVAPQGLALLLTDADTQTETSEDGASLRLLRSSSLPAMHN